MSVSHAQRLNQYNTVAAAGITYDTRGNLTSDGTTTYGYDLYNRLTSAGGASFAYDPAGRLYQSAGAATARFQYDGLDLIAEYDGANVLQRRYVHGPSFDEPLVWYEGAGTSDRRWLIQDQLGSVIAVTGAGGGALAINAYDEYGRPAAANQGRFQYTGQTWLSDASLYHYKARAYSPVLGRFMQTDPILYAGGMNLHAYVGGDPMNRLDPLGLDWVLVCQFLGGTSSFDPETNMITVTPRYRHCVPMWQPGPNEPPTPPGPAPMPPSTSRIGDGEEADPETCNALRQDLRDLHQALRNASAETEGVRQVREGIDYLMSGAWIGDLFGGRGGVLRRGGRSLARQPLGAAGEAYADVTYGSAQAMFGEMEAGIRNAIGQKERELTAAGCR